MQGALLAMLLSTSQLYAASLPPAARGEIEGLLSRLAASGCQFKRNGSWHNAVKAEKGQVRINFIAVKPKLATTLKR